MVMFLPPKPEDETGSPRSDMWNMLGMKRRKNGDKETKMNSFHLGIKPPGRSLPNGWMCLRQAPRLLPPNFQPRNSLAWRSKPRISPRGITHFAILVSKERLRDNNKSKDADVWKASTSRRTSCFYRHLNELTPSYDWHSADQESLKVFEKSLEKPFGVAFGEGLDRPLN